MRVLLVDDHTLFRQGLRTLLEKHGAFQVVGEAEDGRSAVKLVEQFHPDIVVMDIAMKGLNGIEATRQVRQRFPRTQVVVLSMHLLESYVRQALESGAAGYLLKSAAGNELIAALESVRNGGSYFSAPVSRMIVEGYLETNRAAKAEKLSILTPREREVLQLIAEGNSYKEIAAALKISPKTVGQHRERLMQKLHCRRTAELVKYALREGLTPAIE
ncbi:MAG: response regulator transcription factor [Deltaproteobacteria bacterium]|nr:MAG: response regulator transcription factor [Deltaproteobacteria bacterium]